MDINEKDVISFAKVLISLGEIIRDNPDYFIQVVNNAKLEKKTVEFSDRLKEMELIQIYEIAKDKTKEELISYLKKYDSEQLRYLVKFLGLGSFGSKKSVSSLAAHIAEEVKKRNIDVFRDDE